MIEKIDAKLMLQEDCFKRNNFIKFLYEHISTNNYIETIAINGSWGVGKTVLCKKIDYAFNNIQSEEVKSLIKLGKNDLKIKSFYYNAWENYIVGDPVLNMLYGIICSDPIFSEDIINNFDTFKNGLKQMAISFFKNNGFDFDGFFKDDSYYASINRINKIKKIFNDSIENILTVTGAHKVVIIVDELDRCSPRYIIDFIESMRHFYDNNKLTFIVSTDLKQLSYAIGGIYGEKYDSDLYLSKFFDLTLNISIDNYENYFRDVLGVETFTSLYKWRIEKSLIEKFKLTPREILKLSNSLKVIDSLLKVNPFEDNMVNFATTFLNVYGAILKIKEISTFTSFRDGALDKSAFDELFSDLGFNALIKEYVCKLDSSLSTSITSSEKISKFSYDFYKYIYGSSKFIYNKGIDSHDDKFNFNLDLEEIELIKNSLDWI